MHGQPSQPVYVPVYNTPVALNERHTETKAVDPENPYIYIKQHIQDVLDHTLGPMPVDVFTDHFLPDLPPDRRKDVLSSRGAFNAVPTNGSTPSDIYEPLLAALNKSTKHKSRAPGLVFENTSVRSENPHEPGYMKPHICALPSNKVHLAREEPISSRADLGYAELFIEVRPDVSLEYFVDPPPALTLKEHRAHDIVVRFTDQETKYRVERAFGQHIAYATEIQARQHRLFTFSISLCGSRARIYRWDRSGVIVTRSFDIRDQPELLCDFLARFSCASIDLFRGHDGTVRMASKGQEELFRDTVAEHVRAQLGVTGGELDKAVSEHYQKGHVLVIEVYDNDSGQPDPDMTVNQYLVSRPVTSPFFLSGRATRGYWAVHASTGRLCFLKDTWRRATWEPEGNIIKGLHAKGVRNIPIVVGGGDVYYCMPDAGAKRNPYIIHYTRTDIYNGDLWVCRTADKMISVATHVHYRVVFGTVGYPLKRFKGTRELLHATYDVFQAMRDALDKDSRLHRDISIGNVLLVKDETSNCRKGYLIDWEASSRVDNEGKSLRRSRMGTWKFMSIKLLTQPAEPHVVMDDMESLLYVILYCGFLHLAHNVSPRSLRVYMHEFFDKATYERGVMCGGVAKMANRITRTFTRHFQWTSPDYQKWLNTVLDMHGPRPRIDYMTETPPLWRDPEHLDTFWRTFLAEHTLSDADRVDNAPPPHLWASNEAPGSDEPYVAPQHIASSLHTERRPFPAPLASTRKRARSPSPRPLATRRSERLRARAGG
ncbi:hypothetical protein C8Q77DRAFT_1217385 [Trametes polyzona]|nr:hypothetical protein C8Q77DRAFT_1217385 [Trametes polyzona]